MIGSEWRFPRAIIRHIGCNPMIINSLPQYYRSVAFIFSVACLEIATWPSWTTR
jgi:hypothetical protein